jgi:hypothetical protein
MSQSLSPIVFEEVGSVGKLQKTIDFLIADVKTHGGSASQSIKIFDVLWDVTVSSSPWGPIVIKEQITEMDAYFRLFSMRGNVI